MKTPTMSSYLVTWTSQRMPECNMVLVHDEDLARISGICDIDVSNHYIIHCIVLLTSIGTGNPPTGRSGKSPAGFQRGYTHRSMS